MNRYTSKSQDFAHSPSHYLNGNMLKPLLILCVSFGFYRLKVAEATDNFTAVFNATQRAFNLDCGGIFTKKQFVIDSAGYPNGYEKNQECAYLITGENCPTHYSFQFLDFDLEKSLGCTKDRLEDEDADALCGSIDGIKNYFSPNGVLQLKFVSDGEIQGRGFRILVTRLPCDQNHTATETTTEIAFNRGANGVCLNQRPINNFQFCCANSYNAKRFFISSPGFPYSNSNPSDCVYHIYRANNNICRLRLHFLFFWNGLQTPMGCDRGFLEIDGKYICGCRVGLKVISAFDSKWGSSPKVIRFRGEGFPASVFSGFAIEVIQDECPRRYVPEEEAKFYYYNDQKNMVAWPKLNLNLTEEENAMMRHVYVFEAAVENQVRSRERDREETTYIDTSSNPGLFFPNGNDDYKCRMWGVLQWTLLVKETLWQKMPKCASNNIPVVQKCLELTMPSGYLQSPGYPYYYPGNLNLCYRFMGRNGVCSVRLYMADFDVEDSFQCKKDYLIFGQKYRYCGRSLHNTYSTLDLQYKSHEDVHFITDNQICGRGFRGYYEQIPCTDPAMTTPPPYLPPTTKPTPVNPCGRRIAEEIFTIEVYGDNQPTCNFNVIRSDSVCRLEVTFTTFDLPCNSEYLAINNQRFCGSLSGRTMTFPFDYPQLQIVYRKLESFPSSLPPGLRLKLSGRQINRYCEPDVEVPAERQLNHVVKDKRQFKRLGNSSMEVVKQGAQEYDVILRNDYAGVCGLIMDVKRISASSNLCEALLKSRKHVECVPLSTHTAYVPYDGDKIEFRIESPDILQELFVKEVSCGDI